MSGYPIPSEDLAKIIEASDWPCIGDRRCMARKHKDDCVIAIGERLTRERLEREDRSGPIGRNEG